MSKAIILEYCFWEYRVIRHSDPLAFQVIPRCRGYLEKTLFVDVDYPQLIRKKIEVVRNDRELNHVVGINCILPSSGPVILRSENYLAIGCDLRDIKTLNEVLEKEIDVPQCAFLLIAEVSITYMEVKEADAVIQWAAKIGDGKTSTDKKIPVSADISMSSTVLPPGTVPSPWCRSSFCANHAQTLQELADVSERGTSVSND